jgi:hypothetical protein
MVFIKEEFKDTKEVIRIRESKDSTMAKEKGQTTI